MKNLGAVLWCAAMLALTVAGVRAVGTMEPQLVAVQVHPIVAQVGK